MRRRRDHDDCFFEGFVLGFVIGVTLTGAVALIAAFSVS